MKHLWEVDHPYYCNKGNYYSGECGSSFGSLAEFVSSASDEDFDLNLIFRWDWNEGEDYDLPVFTGDQYYRNGELLLFYMGQRKGLYRYVKVSVCRADEPAVIEFLQKRFDHLLKLWEPFAPSEFLAQQSIEPVTSGVD